MSAGGEHGLEAPQVHDVPIGIEVPDTATRHETDSMGGIEVPADRYWGAQTQRSLVHFSIGDDRMPKAVYHAYGHVKKAAAVVNGRAGRLPGWMADLISQVADEVVAGDLDDSFPLYVWQTGSGTQSNMNTNEVISNRCIQLVGGELGSKAPVHPNDHVNMGQSSNDTFPTAMHMATVTEITDHLIPHVAALHGALDAKAHQWHDVVKIGRTHLEDAVPLTVGQEWSGYAAQVGAGLDRLSATLPGLHEIAMGGTAVGTGLNAPPRVRRRRRRADRPADRPAVHHRAQQVRSPGRPGRDGRRLRGAACPGGAADEDRQRHPVAGLRAAVRHQ